MLDFVKIATRSPKRGVVEVYPIFLIKRFTDLMIRGGDFYAVWDEENKIWSRDELTVVELIDQEIERRVDELSSDSVDHVIPKYMSDASSGSIDDWHRYVQHQSSDKFIPLDNSLTFANTEPTKKNYSSHSLPYPLAAGDYSAFDELIGTLYSPDERHKLEWAIGSIVSGDSKDLQKFIVIYGSAGTGKSTILNIVQMLFEGYYSVFDAKALGSSTSSFALEPFSTNPLVAIQHDGDLSRIEDNTRLNSLVSHEQMIVNEKYKSAYSSKFSAFLFMGTNSPVRITNAKSGILRRLIDVSPSGNKIPVKRYNELMAHVKFELGAIAYHCLEVYKANPQAYDNYIPVTMLGASNDFYNFVLDSYQLFAEHDGTTLNAAWKLYREYCTESLVSYPYPKRTFKEELRNYFDDFKERDRDEDGTQIWNHYIGFKTDKFDYVPAEKVVKESVIETGWLKFGTAGPGFVSKLDELYSDRPAQYASAAGTPKQSWDKVKTTLKDIDPRKLHYALFPGDHIFIDFDLKDENGNKSFKRNYEAASKWKPTYAELSKSGCGIHLHYIYDGDVNTLAKLYEPDIEIKLCTGKRSIRRLLTKCNDLPVATLNSGLPLKGEQKMINTEGFKNDKELKALIIKALKKEVWPNTKPSIDFINHILEKAYYSGLKYDLTTMRPSVMAFANSSTHQAEVCIDIVDKMKFKSDEPSVPMGYDNDTIIFFDVEVFPNLFVVCWKVAGKPAVSMINPSPAQIEALSKYKLVGFNNRRYDNHIMYARMLGYSNEALYKVSQRIILNSENAFFGEAYNFSYTDIYDFSSEKKSLKKFEIELKIHHQELGMKWDQPVPEDKWDLVAEYCINDVEATEAVWNARQGDFIAREILADVAGMTVNDTTNSLTTRIIFGNNRHPQNEFNYRNLAEPCSDKPYFPGYEFKDGKSYYKGFEVGEGGRVFARPGMYGRTITFDVASMHPHSVIAENLFGDEYTKRFRELVEARVAIKHKDFEAAKQMLDGKLAKHLSDEKKAKAVAQALKIAINSVYGLTAAKFENPFRDPRNVDNIVAKRGALFMMDLMDEVEKLGGHVVHIKTDSIKLKEPSDYICNFVLEFGKKYGYTFEIEHIFDRICLVNDAVYIAKLADDDPEEPGEWTSTGTQFSVPYVFKTLFSKEPIEFDDLCETKSVTSALYLDLNENLPEGEHDYRFVGKAGLFCPIQPGKNGGLLLRESSDGKFGAVTGTKGFRWLESESVAEFHREADIDRQYYISLCNAAIETISKFGDFEEFVNVEHYISDFMSIPSGAPEPGVPFD